MSATTPHHPRDSGSQTNTHLLRRPHHAPIGVDLKALRPLRGPARSGYARALTSTPISARPHPSGEDQKTTRSPLDRLRSFRDDPHKPHRERSRAWALPVRTTNHHRVTYLEENEICLRRGSGRSVVREAVNASTATRILPCSYTEGNYRPFWTPCTQDPQLGRRTIMIPNFVEQHRPPWCAIKVFPAPVHGRCTAKSSRSSLKRRWG